MRPNGCSKLHHNGSYGVVPEMDISVQELGGTAMSRCGQTCTAPTSMQAHCATCHRTFGGVTGFDAHRRAGACLDPSTLGYANRAGVWRLPMPEAELKRRRGLRPIPATADGLERVGGTRGSKRAKNTDLATVGAPIGSEAAFLEAIRGAP